MATGASLAERKLAREHLLPEAGSRRKMLKVDSVCLPTQVGEPPGERGEGRTGVSPELPIPEPFRAMLTSSLGTGSPFKEGEEET